MVKNNGTPVVEEVRIKSEQEIIQELQEQLDVLKIDNEELEKKQLRISELETELTEERRHASRMDELYWEVLRERDELKREKGEKGREIEELKRRINNLGKELTKEKTKSISLQQELNQKNQSSKENQTNSPWQDFYNWLHSNIVDINAKGIGKGNIKHGKRSEYSSLVSAPGLMGLLLNTLEKTLDKPLMNYTGSGILEGIETIDISPNDIGDRNAFASNLGIITEQVLRMNRGGARSGYEKLFREWRNNASSSEN